MEIFNKMQEWYDCDVDARPTSFVCEGVELDDEEVCDVLEAVDVHGAEVVYAVAQVRGWAYLDSDEVDEAYCCTYASLQEFVEEWIDNQLEGKDVCGVIRTSISWEDCWCDLQHDYTAVNVEGEGTSQIIVVWR